MYKQRTSVFIFGITLMALTVFSSVQAMDQILSDEQEVLARVAAVKSSMDGQTVELVTEYNDEVLKYGNAKDEKVLRLDATRDFLCKHLKAMAKGLQVMGVLGFNFDALDLTTCRLDDLKQLYERINQRVRFNGKGEKYQITFPFHQVPLRFEQLMQDEMEYELPKSTKLFVPIKAADSETVDCKVVEKKATPAPPLFAPRAMRPGEVISGASLSSLSSSAPQAERVIFSGPLLPSRSAEFQNSVLFPPLCKRTRYTITDKRAVEQHRYVPLKIISSGEGLG